MNLVVCLKLRFNVHHKSTNKNELIDFYSHHVNKTKKIRALRICSSKYVHEEEYIKILSNSYTTLYISYLMQKENPTKYSITIPKKTENNKTRRIILPTNSITKTLNNTLHTSNVQIINSTSKIINDIISKKVNRNKNSAPEVRVYSIRCATFKEPYIGDTSRPFKKRIYE